MNCPLKSGSSSSSGSASGPGPGYSYNEYLKIDDILQLQVPLSEKVGKNLVHDEYLFIIIHQTYELWFKLIIIELDSIRELLLQPKLDEGNTLVIVSRLGRIVKILKVLVDQINVLETLTPHDFDDFRKYLSPASGFQSFQFRLIENKLGVVKNNRIKHNNNDYSEAVGLNESDKERIKSSEIEHSLLKLIDNWLSRTPGLEEEGFNFPGKLKEAVQKMCEDSNEEANEKVNEEEKEFLLKELQTKKVGFDNFFNEEKHKNLKKEGHKRLSFKAMQGAMFIFLYRDEPRLNQPFQVLSLLMDIDSLLIKWRYNHAIMVQRMIGSKTGTGGSSGYYYLIATASDRYKVFLDLFNLASFIIPRKYIPPLDSNMKKCLSVFNLETTSEETGECCDCNKV